MKRLLLCGLVLGLCLGSVQANELVQEVQTRLKKSGFYHGKTTGNYDSETSAAVTRYQIRKGLAISGKLDAATLNALDVPPPKDASAVEPSPESGTWRRLRNGDMQFLKKLNAGEIPPPPKPSATPRPTRAPARVAKRSTPVPAPTPARAEPVHADYGRERMRDYVGAFVLAGLDPQVGAELEFFADRVDYFGEANVPRKKIRRDLLRYDRQWPERRFWLAGDLQVKRLPNEMLRVSFPLRYELRSGSRKASGTVQKTLLLRKAGAGDLEIVGVEERKK